MEMTNLNRSLEDCKLNELFELAAWLHGEEFPSPVIVQKKKAIVEMLANQLSVERKEIIWMVEAKEKKEFVYKCMNAKGRMLPYWRVIKIGNY